MPKTNTLTILIFILIAGFFLRVSNLTNLPPALNWDEISHAYNSFSLLHTGRDQWGVAWPVFNFRAYGDYPASLNIFLTVLPIAIFGPTDFAVRFPHALIGGLTIFTVFMATYAWRKNRTIALLAAMFVAFDPWTLFTSRAVFQSNWVVFLLSLGLYFYFRKKYSTTILFWGLSLYAYHNARIFVPLLILPLLWTYCRSRRTLLLTALLFIPVLIAVISPAGHARSSWVGLIDSGAVSYLNQQRQLSTLAPVFTKLLYNRPVYFLTHFITNYIGYFSPQFLFISGGTQSQFSLPGYGVLPIVSLPFYYLGLILLFRHRQKFLLYWLLLAPLPAAITRDPYAVIRSTTFLPVVELVTAFGLYSVYAFIPRRSLRRVFLGAFLTLTAVLLFRYVTAYVTVYPKVYSSSWQYGYRQLAAYISGNSASFDHIIITKKYGEPHEFILWYLRILPPRYLSGSDFRWDYHADWYWVNAFGKFTFVNDWDMRDYVSQAVPGQKYLIVSSPGNLTSGNTVSQINFLNGQPAFIIKTI